MAQRLRCERVGKAFAQQRSEGGLRLAGSARGLSLQRAADDRPKLGFIKQQVQGPLPSRHAVLWPCAPYARDGCPAAWPEGPLGAQIHA